MHGKKIGKPHIHAHTNDKSHTKNNGQCRCHSVSLRKQQVQGFRTFPKHSDVLGTLRPHGLVWWTRTRDEILFPARFFQVLAHTISNFCSDANNTQTELVLCSCEFLTGHSVSRPETGEAIVPASNRLFSCNSRSNVCDILRLLLELITFSSDNNFVTVFHLTVGWLVH